MPRLPPTTTTQPLAPMSASSFVLLISPPHVHPTVRMAPRRLRCLGLDPSHASGPGVEEAMGRSDGRKDHVAGPDGVLDVIQNRLDLSLEEEVRLLEWVIMHLG